MKRIITLVLAAFLFIACIPPVHADNSYDRSRLDYKEAYEFLELLNQKRASTGLGTLTMDRELLDGASIRAYEQSIVFGHQRPDGSNFSTVCKNAHAECVHYWFPANQSTPQTALDSLLNSPPHRFALLNSIYNSAGVGVYEINGRKNWAILLSVNNASDAVYSLDKGPKKTVGSFCDVFESDYYADPVEWAVNRRITTGTSANTFSPDATCTRAQFLTFLWRSAGAPSPLLHNERTFYDVIPGSFYENAVRWAVENSIATGTGANLFSPDSPCSRAEVVTFLWRMKGCPKTGSSNPFKDIRFGQYYTDAVLWAAKTQITNGIDTTHFSPNTLCSRAQAVSFLYRADNFPDAPPVVFGDAGRLYIGSLSVALYNSLSQKVVDDEDSAFFYVRHGTIAIGDHNNQGFDIIKSCSVGDQCCILHPDGTRDLFVCRRIERTGQNIGSDVIDHDGQSAFRAGFDMFTMTCNDSGCRNVTVVYWDRI